MGEDKPKPADDPQGLARQPSNHECAWSAVLMIHRNFFVLVLAVRALAQPRRNASRTVRRVRVAATGTSRTSQTLMVRYLVGPQQDPQQAPPIQSTLTHHGPTQEPCGHALPCRPRLRAPAISWLCACAKMAGHDGADAAIAAAMAEMALPSPADVAMQTRAAFENTDEYKKMNKTQVQPTGAQAHTTSYIRYDWTMAQH